MRKIKQNLIWAFGYNAIGIQIAPLGYLNPIIAGSDGFVLAVADCQFGPAQAPQGG